MVRWRGPSACPRPAGTASAAPAWHGPLSGDAGGAPQAPRTRKPSNQPTRKSEAASFLPHPRPIRGLPSTRAGLPFDRVAFPPGRGQIYGQVIDLVVFDHLDVVGQLHRDDDPHADWLPSGSRFDERRFRRVWRGVANEIVAAGLGGGPGGCAGPVSASAAPQPQDPAQRGEGRQREGRGARLRHADRALGDRQQIREVGRAIAESHASKAIPGIRVGRRNRKKPFPRFVKDASSSTPSARRSGPV